MSRILEYRIHCDVVSFIRANIPRRPNLEFWFHAANGEYRDIKTALKLSLMKVESGVPDLIHPAGCALELKAPGKKLKPAQERWREYLIKIGYEYFSTDDVTAAREWIKTSRSWLIKPQKIVTFEIP